jgi:hypothetical protein
VNAVLPLKRPQFDVDLDEIGRQQRAINAAAIKRGASEPWFQDWCRKTLLTSRPPPLAVVEFWEGDQPAIERALVALDSLEILITHGGPLSDVAIELALDWIAEARAALRRFETVMGPRP